MSHILHRLVVIAIGILLHCASGSSPSDAQITQMDTSILMSVEGADGVIDGESGVPGYENWHYVYGFNHQFVFADHGDATPAIGPLISGFFSVKTFINGGTLDLLRYIDEGTYLTSVLIGFFHPDITGTIYERVRITMENVYIVAHELEGSDPNTFDEYQILTLYPATQLWNDVSPGSILPLSLTEFSATSNDEDVVIAWTTEIEQGLLRFEVEHFNGDIYETVATVEAAGFTTSTQHYEVKVADVGAGAHSFRLKSVTFTGDAKYSAPVEVEVAYLGERMRFTEPHPNPGWGVIEFDLTVEVDQEVRIGLYDVLGREIRSLHQGTMQGATRHTFTIDASGLSQGLYLLRLAGQQIDETRAIRVLHR